MSRPSGAQRQCAISMGFADGTRAVQMNSGPPNNSMQRTTLRAAADAERSAVLPAVELLLDPLVHKPLRLETPSCRFLLHCVMLGDRLRLAEQIVCRARSGRLRAEHERLPEAHLLELLGCDAMPSDVLHTFFRPQDLRDRRLLAAERHPPARRNLVGDAKETS